MNMKHGVWAQDEHDRFLEAIKLYPEGPWRLITQHVGTRSVRQVQTHAQKYHEKIARRMRGLRKERTKWARLEHRIEDDLLQLCKQAEGYGVYHPEGTPRSVTMVTTPPSQPPLLPSLIKLEPNTESEEVYIKPEPISDVYNHSECHDQPTGTHSLPSLDESLDFFIECLSD
ncbi:hypothetical protein Poli38472_011979 [Pythium oligandrum]|uniref:Uncharacterized protein n=1 Tax=Pythium oligandrum TaxID=41045 RepID=A0A8K1CR76_PYTOL|nr:hypothetical protein Poli38472_011979 [Pythium oligandrum]|eukprot:TMW66863.1 hypothetical protein Poli38472_011979 [Pythium oligandrum]